MNAEQRTPSFGSVWFPEIAFGCDLNLRISQRTNENAGFDCVDACGRWQ
jgi:hypothetical protein